MENTNEENKKNNKELASPSPFLQEELTNILPNQKKAEEEIKTENPFEANTDSNQPNTAKKDKKKEKVAIPDVSAAKEVVQADQLNFFKRNFTLLIKLAILFLVLMVILAAGVFGMEQYEKYYKEISLEEILPAGASLVVKVTIDPESRQFKLLEDNMQKFPGYEILKKEIDKVGEGKTASQAFQDKLKDLNLDFQQDIKPILGENAYVVVPDLSPLGESLQNRILLSQKEVRGLLGKIAPSGNLAEKEIAAAGEEEEKPTVLGETMDRLAKIAAPSEDDNKPEKLLDFIMASEISDLKKAKDVLDKIKKDNEYEVTELKYGGFAYYKLKAKNSENQNDIDKLFKVQETYHAVLGKNWVMASREDDLKGAISRARKNLTIPGLFYKENNPSLADDADYRKVIDNINKVREENLITLYYKINFNEFFKKKECAGEADCEDITNYIKYPQDLIAGFMVKMNPQGVIVKTSSNNLTSENSARKSLKEGLSTKIPQKINDRWTDVFLEHNSVKAAYYNFKKNNLTNKGLEALNNALAGVRQEIGIDLERDFIDQIDGGLAAVIFSAKDLEPQGALVVEIKDSERMVESMKKVVELVKTRYAGIFSTMEGDYFSPQIQSSLTPDQKAKMAEQEKKDKEMFDKIMQSQITETDTPYGKIYSYKLPLAEEEFLGGVSFDFSAQDNLFIWGSHYGAVESLMGEVKEGTGKKLADNDFYKKAMIYSFPDGYTDTFVYTPGVWDIVEYYIKKMGEESTAARATYCAEADGSSSYCSSPPSDSEEETFAIGSILRTLKIMNFSKALKDGFSRSAIFVNIEELPKEEKERAARALENMTNGLVSANEKAQYASFKSAVQSTLPQMIIACDEGKINKEDLESVYNKSYYGSEESYKTLTQKCGPNTTGEFLVTFKGINDYSQYTATCTENGCKFSP